MMAEFLLKVVISNTGGWIIAPVSSEPLTMQDNRKENTKTERSVLREEEICAIMKMKPVIAPK